MFHTHYEAPEIHPLKTYILSHKGAIYYNLLQIIIIIKKSTLTGPVNNNRKLDTLRCLCLFPEKHQRAVWENECAGHRGFQLPEMNTLFNLRHHLMVITWEAHRDNSFVGQAWKTSQDLLITGSAAHQIFHFSVWPSTYCLRWLFYLCNLWPVLWILAQQQQ